MGELEISFFLEPSFEDFRGQRWPIVRLIVGQDIAWDMAPNPTVPFSLLSPRAREDIESRVGKLPVQGDTVVLQNLTIAGQRILDLPVRIDPTVLRRRVDGVLGLNFFNQFDEIRWNPRTHLVTMIKN